MIHKPFWPAATLVALLLTGVSARADAIDGAWCQGLRQIFVNGPQITTSGGHRITGSYDRHRVEYIVPDGEPGAGATAIMSLQHEELAHRQLSTDPEKIESWERCRRQVS